MQSKFSLFICFFIFALLLLFKAPKVFAQSTIPCTSADINKSGFVDLYDYALLVKDFFKVTTTPADINVDGKVNLNDYSILVRYFFKYCTATPTPTILPGADLPAFPGAEGFGAKSKGGRNGRVLKVTNLNDSGPGSLRQALEVETGPRTVVFSTGGTIALSRPIEMIGEGASYVTIAGQTAPGGGIQIKNHGIHLFNGVHDVVIRFLRMRIGQRSDYNFVDDVDNIEIWGNTAPVYNIVVDHISAQWALDENTSVWGNAYDITYQYNIIAEATLNGQENKNAKAMLIGTDSPSKLPRNISIHHNVYANNPDRNPRVAFADTDFRNNIIYNWKNNSSTMFGEYQSSYGLPTRVNAVNNIWKRGPSSTENTAIWAIDGLKLFVQGNWSPLCPTGCSTNEWSMGISEEIDPYPAALESTYRASTAFSFPTVTTHDTAELSNLLMNTAGAYLPTRDATDNRILNDVTNGTGQAGIGTGGFPTLAAGTPPTDTDQDGIPNTWEQSKGLNPNSNTDALETAPSGYTWIEEYINSLVQ